MPSSTRGHGLLEGFLSHHRARVADRLIPETLRQGRLLDIGCGTRPGFLLGVRFAEKVGMDRCASAMTEEALAATGILRITHDLEAAPRLPFEDDRFSAVTLLSVVEHLEPASVAGLFAEIYRVLRPGGLFVCVTPPPFTDGILRVMARLGLVSPEEIHEHKAFYRCAQLRTFLRKAGFTGVRAGRFEMGMNQWAFGNRAE
ncbi:MAG: methyltransferase domain-containing protein [Fibrobacterota bacterium]